MRRSLSILVLLPLLAAVASAQSLPAEARAYLGDWTTYNQSTDEAEVVIRITESGGVVSGRVVRVLCGECGGRYSDPDPLTVPVIEDMQWDDDKFEGGSLADPVDGKTYWGSLKLADPDRLHVRPYRHPTLRTGPFRGMLQIWYRTP